MERQRILTHSGLPFLDHLQLVWNTAARNFLPTARPHPRISRACLHHRGQERPIWVRARGPHLLGRQGARRRVPVPPAARTPHPAFALDSHPQRPPQLSVGEGGGWRERYELVPQVRNILYSMFWCNSFPTAYNTFWYCCFETIFTVRSDGTESQLFVYHVLMPQIYIVDITFWCHSFPTL